MSQKPTKEMMWNRDKLGWDEQNFLIVPPFWALNCGPACLATHKPKQLLPCGPNGVAPLAKRRPLNVRGLDNVEFVTV